MLSQLYRRFYIFAPSIVSAISQRSNSLPRSLQPLIPTCAQDCLASAVHNSYPVSICPGSSDLDCFCSRFGLTGYTLGELAFSCLCSSCSLETVTNTSSIYNICIGQNNAVQPTHRILTVTAVLTSTSAVLPPSSIPSTTELTLLSTQKPTSPVPTASPQSSQSSSAGNAAAPTNSKKLTTAQLVGICVAGAASVFLAIGFALLLACLNRRRHRKLNEQENEKFAFDFVDAGLSPYSRYPVMKIGMKDPRGGAGGVGVVPRWNAPTDANSRRDQSSSDPHIAPGEIGLPISPEMQQERTPASIISTRTASRLLPDKPSSAPKKLPTIPRPPSAVTQNTTFEEDGPLSPKFATPSNRDSRRVSVAPDRLPEVPARGLAIRHESLRPPPLSLQIPVLPSRYQAYQPPEIIETRQQSLQPSNETPRDHSQASTSSSPRQASSTTTLSSRTTTSSSDHLLDSYFETNASTISPERTLKLARLVKPELIITPSTAGRKEGRYSTTSDTSFESADPDDATPPEEEPNKLSPVAESPISGLRYPKVPRGSNQAVPRSPRSPRSSNSPTTQQPAGGHPLTLLAKRRGEDSADDIRRRLWITEPNSISSSAITHIRTGSDDATTNTRRHSRNTSGSASDRYIPFRYPEQGTSSFDRPAKRLDYQRAGPQSAVARTPPMEILSPLWAPTLTPSRLGEDLYISVT